MNIVNIRTVPINRVHRGGLVIMSKRVAEHEKKYDTGRKTKRGTDSEKSTGRGQKHRDCGVKEDTESNKDSEGGREIECQNNKARGAEIMTETEIKRHQERQEN